MSTIPVSETLLLRRCQHQSSSSAWRYSLQEQHKARSTWSLCINKLSLMSGLTMLLRRGIDKSSTIKTFKWLSVY